MDISNNPLTAYWNCSQADKRSDLDDLEKAEFEAYEHLQHVMLSLPRDDTPQHRPLPLSSEQRATYNAAKTAFVAARDAVSAAMIENKLCEQRYTVPPRKLANPSLVDGLQPPKL